MKVAYIRVSTLEQNTARQDTMFKDYDRIYTEKVSGKNADRPELKKMLEFVREGDSVTVESYSRLARNTKDLLNIVDELNSKGVAFISLHEQIDTSTPSGKFMMTVFAGLAQFEREQTLQRQAEGIAEAKKAGKYTGRKPCSFDPDRMKVEVSAVRAKKQTHEQAMKALGLKPNTYYRRVKEMGL